ncbi:MAG: Nucleoside-diphosphate-sugar epimerase [Edaphobacter sp.]|nr:Nucleoside-diphosphate-sugar epimerase [Edaphobacter sp.]
MRCLITGVSGFLGSHLARALIAEGHDVLAIVRPTSDLWRLDEIKSKLSFAFATLNTIETAREPIAKFRPEVAFHLAWTGGNSNKFVNQLSQVFENVPGTLELVRILAEAGCATVIYAGSSVEYGVFNIPASESDLPKPANLYGAAKYGAEVLVNGLCHAYRMRFCGVRVFWTYGPQDEAVRMIPSVIASLLDVQRPRLTEGRQLWDFLYIDDAVRAFLLLASTVSAEGVFNLGSGQPVTIRAVVESIRDLIDPSLELGFGEVPYGANQVMHLQPDVSQLQTATGWRPEVGLTDGIRRTVEWHRAQRMSRPGEARK